MSYDEFKDLCRKSWEEDYIHLCIDRYKNRNQGRYCICNESKNTYKECTPEAKRFDKLNCYIQLKKEKIWKK